MKSKNTSHVDVQVLPASKEILYEQRESGLTHSDFNREYVVFKAIEQGAVDVLPNLLEQYFSRGLIVGNLSKNSLRQTKYWAVSTVAVAIHYAILGGLDETDAFNMSDICIRAIDELADMDAILTYLSEQALTLAQMVQESRRYHSDSSIIKACLHYIHIHLHERLTIEQISESIGVSRDYLSRIFSQEVGQSLHQYILLEKLEASKIMLLADAPYSTISYQLAFCSESHYITCFKRVYGMTPKQFLKAIRS